MIDFNASKEDFTTASAIAKRAAELAKAHEVKLSMSDVVMDIVATHANGCPLKLTELLAADDGNFAHDVFGIRRHLNRSTGKLEDCFLPRFAA